MSGVVKPTHPLVVAQRLIHLKSQPINLPSGFGGSHDLTHLVEASAVVYEPRFPEWSSPDPVSVEVKAVVRVVTVADVMVMAPVV